MAVLFLHFTESIIILVVEVNFVMLGHDYLTIWLHSLQGVRFSMPLCTTEVEEATEDDLIEFSKIQTLNLGQVPFAS
jgi:hypothetical protein